MPAAGVCYSRSMATGNRLTLTNDGDGGVFTTLQGEGRYVGRPSTFVRLSGCNLRCEWRNPDGSTTRCDTPYSSFTPEHNPRSIDDILQQVVNAGVEHVVVTGGEPYLQTEVAALIDHLVDAGHFVTVETNGTIYRPSRAQYVSLSPKLPSSRAINGWKTEAIVPEALRSFMQHHTYQLKFVINDPTDFDEVERFRLEYNAPKETIYCMPQGVDDAALRQRAAWCTELCTRHGFNYGARLHIWLWGNTRGT